MKIVILGSGLVGAPMAVDLVKEKNFAVTVVDINSASLEKLKAKNKLNTIVKDLSNPENVKTVIGDYDFVVSAVPGFMGFNTLKAIIETGKNVVDISFFPEDPFLLEKLSKTKNVIAVFDCGVMPGMGNILAMHAHRQLDITDRVLIYVGGLPKIREWPYEYKAVFSPIDVIEEYTRPARYKENGVMVVRPALSDSEFISFPGLGTLEAFNTDGLRTMLATIAAPNLKEKTLRYPGHIEKMAMLRETGFFNTEEIEIKGIRIRPIDFTARLLFPKWKLKEQEADITVMQIIVEGEKNDKKVRYTYDLFDTYDPVTDTTSMARTTGYTATVTVRMIADGFYSDKGISPPEFLGRKKECVDYLLKGLKERNILYKETISEINKEII